MWPTSQAAGNQHSSNAKAMTAPGSMPVNKLSDRDEQIEPAVGLGPETPPGTSGKPQASGQHWTPPGEPRWTKTTTPDVVRKPPKYPPDAEVA